MDTVMGTVLDRDTPFIQPNYFVECIKINKILCVPEDEIRSKTGWDFEEYQKNPAPLSFNQIDGLLNFAYTTLKMPYLGLAVGQQWRLSFHGMAGISAMAQQTYRECLESTARLCDKAFPAYSIEMIETETQIGLRVSEAFSLAPQSQFFMEATMVSFYNIFHFLLGDDVEPEYLSFAYPKPSYGKVYSRYFHCPLQFDAAENEFLVSKKYANVELKLADRSTAEMAEHSFNQSLPDLDLNHLPKKLRLLLIQSMGAFPNLDTAARKIGMSGRTLRRKLNGMGTNYQHEIEQVRKERAINSLRIGNDSITEIGLRLGYCDTSAFSRAFKGWTGESPRQYKNNHAEGVTDTDTEDCKYESLG